MSFSAMSEFVAPEPVKPVDPRRAEWDQIAKHIVDLGGEAEISTNKVDCGAFADDNGFYGRGYAVALVRDREMIVAGEDPARVKIEICETLTGNTWNKKSTGWYRIMIGFGPSERLGGGKNGIPHLKAAQRLLAHARMQKKEEQRLQERNAKADAAKALADRIRKSMDNDCVDCVQRDNDKVFIRLEINDAVNAVKLLEYAKGLGFLE